ncbi:hypothetical protein [Yeosuana marina]|uniref:hypothetical protein n=1 Tax=Yeosuana marina TaxID=1565536 RepID=UPI00142121D9|nr:hypothetical protein [Yeosuana marina]
MKLGKIQLETRTFVLERTLQTEDAINDLLLLYLGISDKNSTKLFGQKVGISFKNKIDLLHDIDVILKEEHLDLELLMTFRNKFVHDVNSNDFLSVLKQFDNGIKNRFNKYFDKNISIDNEEDCKIAYGNLHLKSVKVILEKIRNKRKLYEKKAKLLKALLYRSELLTDSAFRFVDNLFEILENADLEDDKIAELANIINTEIQKYTNELQFDEKYEKSNQILSELLFKDDNLKKIFK